MNYDEEYVNEIVNVNEKTNYLMKKYKNSLDYEKLNSVDYLNYKLKEKITNFLIPLNLNSLIIDKIYLLTKKFKSRIKQNKLIPIVSYIVIQENGLNISHNELFKKLKLKKTWYIKYAKYIKDNGARINELSNLEKNKRKKKKSIPGENISNLELDNNKDNIQTDTIYKKDLDNINLNVDQKLMNIMIDNNHNSVELQEKEKSIYFYFIYYNKLIIL